jgi:hypothetical protein
MEEIIIKKKTGSKAQIMYVRRDSSQHVIVLAFCCCLQFVYILLLLFTYTMEQNLLEKLTGSQIVKQFPSFYGARRFITAVKSALH